jgi:dolichol-phosphate mannosyltransferase
MSDTSSQPDGLRASVVIPALNEVGNIRALCERIDVALQAYQPFEVIVVDDASTDGTADAVADGPAHWRVLQHDQRAGQSAGIHSGVNAAKARIILTLDGDGQNPPEELPNLLAAFESEDDGTLGVVAGQRVGRKDTLSKKLASRFANGLRGWALQDGTRDTGCGLKAFDRDKFLTLPYFNHMHRYMPALFKRHGWRVAHLDVSHAARMSGRSNYSNLQRALVGIVDLIGVMWLLRRRKTAEAQEIERT